MRCESAGAANARGAATEVPGGAPSAVVGTLLIVMAFGLLARSRLAWAISIIAAIGRDQRPGRVLIAGSLYLADVVLRQDAEE